MHTLCTLPFSCNTVATEVKVQTLLTFCFLHRPSVEFWGSSSLCSIQGHLWGGFNHAPRQKKHRVCFHKFCTTVEQKIEKITSTQGSSPTFGLELWPKRGGGVTESCLYTWPKRCNTVERLKTHRYPKGLWWHKEESDVLLSHILYSWK